MNKTKRSLLWEIFLWSFFELVILGLSGVLCLSIKQAKFGFFMLSVFGANMMLLIIFQFYWKIFISGSKHLKLFAHAIRIMMSSAFIIFGSGVLCAFFYGKDPTLMVCAFLVALTGAIAFLRNLKILIDYYKWMPKPEKHGETQ